MLKFQFQLNQPNTVPKIDLFEFEFQSNNLEQKFIFLFLTV